MVNLFKFYVVLSSIYLVKCARILGIFHMPSKGHLQIGDRVLKELAARGHEVTFISPFELDEPVKNLKQIVLTGFLESVQDTMRFLYHEAEMSTFGKVIVLDETGYRFTEATLNHTNVQKLLKSNATFDLVIHDLYFNEAFVGFAEYYKVPSIAISTQGAMQSVSSKMANPHNPAYISSYLLSYTSNMNLLQRTLNAFVYIGAELYTHMYSLPNQNKLLQKYFPGFPHLYQLHYNTSLMLINSHVSTHHPLPLLPNMIEIGGCHIRPTKALTKHLQDYLDNAKDGVIVFSMGSVLKSKEMPVEARNVILKTFGKLKQQVLWKWEDDLLPGQPPNVKLTKWLPQQDVLAHPNIKLFITHGGLFSTIEAIYYGVPILGLPVNGDQELNIVNAANDGYGIGIPLKDINEASFSNAINELLYNPKYKEIVKTKSQLLHDQPEKPINTAIFWIEYVIRHRGAHHLQTAALNLWWFQQLLLDVVVIVILGITIILYVLYKGLRLLRPKTNDNMNLEKKRR